MTGTETSPPAGTTPDDALLRAWASMGGRGGPLEQAMRSGVLRRPGAGHILGVCAALADGLGLPVRLVRLAAVGLFVLGLGLPTYLILAAVLPRERPATDGRGVVVDTPWGALWQRSAGRGDLLTLVAVVPSVVIGAVWLLILVNEGVAPVFVLVAVVGALLGVLAWGAHRARRARRGYLLAELAARAGILDETQLAATLGDLRRWAPRAWGSAAVPDADRRRRRDRPPRLSLRMTLGSAGALLAVGTLVFLLVSVQPSLVPAFAVDPPLPGIGRTGVAAGVATMVAGALLIAIGLAGRRSTVITTIGALAFLLFSGSVIWVRVTDASATNPIVISVDGYVPGESISCPVSGPREWDRRMIIDMSHMEKPAERSELISTWLAQHPHVSPSEMDLTMRISCSRAVGDLTVILPPKEAGLPVSTTMEAALGREEGPVPTTHALTFTGDPSIHLSGRLSTGSIRYQEAKR